jgi:hypothetical protein
MKSTILFSTILFLLTLLSTPMSFALQSDQLRFAYSPNDDAASSCTHHLINDYLNDWIVKCPHYSKVKEFVVHLLVRNYPSPTPPQDRYEVIYWVTNRIPGAKVPEFTGTTLWFNLIKSAQPHSLKLGQFVDNGYASLDLQIMIPANL